MVDLCAGAGGKTLALAAVMENKGQIFATDTDKRRLAPIHERLERAGARNVQVRTPRGAKDALAGLASRADLVLIDAPCTGTGAGGAIRTPNGACVRARSTSASRIRSKRSIAPCRWSSPAGGSPM